MSELKSLPEVITQTLPGTLSREGVINPPSGEAVIATVLVPQMGSSDKFLQRGEIDQRKFAILTDEEQVALMHFDYRGAVDGIRYFARLVDFILNSSPSIGGRGRMQVIDITGAATGGGAGRVADKPGLLARSIWNRDWKDKARERGETVPGA